VKRWRLKLNNGEQASVIKKTKVLHVTDGLDAAIYMPVFGDCSTVAALMCYVPFI
jgi:hypothetical protein